MALWGSGVRIPSAPPKFFLYPPPAFVWLGGVDTMRIRNSSFVWNKKDPLSSQMKAKLDLNCKRPRNHQPLANADFPRSALQSDWTLTANSSFRIRNSASNEKTPLPNSEKSWKRRFLSSLSIANSRPQITGCWVTLAKRRITKQNSPLPKTLLGTGLGKVISVVSQPKKSTDL